MEKSWENFWTTGKVEDYLTYRNRFAENERENRENVEKQNEANRQDERDSSWKGLK